MLKIGVICQKEDLKFTTRSGDTINIQNNKNNNRPRTDP